MANLKTTLHSLGNNNKISLVAGDFNFDIFKYEHSKVINSLLKHMHSNFFQSCILEITIAILNSKPSLVNNIYEYTYDKKIHSGKVLDMVMGYMPNFYIFEDIYKAFLKKD